MKRGRRLQIGALLLLFTSLLAGQTTTSPRDVLDRATSLLDGAIARYDDDEIVSATDLIRNVLAVNPRFAEAYVRLGEALLWLDDLDGAEAAFLEARALRYRAVDLPLLEARRDVLAGELARAETRYRDILTAQPYNEQARVGLAILELSAGPTETAVGQLEQLTRRFPENRQLLIVLAQLMADRGDGERLGRYLGLALQYHNDSATVQLLAAQLALEGGRLDAASFHANNAISLAPKLTEAWMVLARVAAERGDVAQARRFYEELIRLDPSNHAAWYARGEFFAREQRLEEARQSWEHALELRPDFELARFALENTVIAERDLDDPIRGALAAEYRRSGRQLEGRFLSRQAERHYRRGLQLNPFDPILRARLADLYLQQGMESRYLAELLLIRERGLATNEPAGITQRELTARIELFSARLQSSPASRWEVDQFTAPRPRTRIALVAAADDRSLFPGAERHVAAYVAALLQTSQNISVLQTDVTRESHSALIGSARRLGADQLAILHVHVGDRFTDLRLQILRTDTAELLLDRTVRRTGNDRLDGVSRAAAELIDGRIIPRGTVLDRRFDEVAVSIGSVDGLSLDDEVDFFSAADGRSLGRGTISALDDLMAIAEYQPDGPDNLTVNDTAVPVSVEEPPTDSNESDLTEELSAPPPALQQPTSGLTGFVQRLFQLR